jgi:hypothetical protein
MPVISVMPVPTSGQAVVASAMSWMAPRCDGQTKRESASSSWHQS